MTISKSRKIDLLEHFYEHLTEEDWLEGVDLYQSGRTCDVSTLHGLITGRVSSPTQSKSEVRIKIHPSGKVIQWIECTCRKNRVQGYYCEHIAALMIHIDRERSELFNNLDVKMPLKPPTKPKRARLAPTQETKESKSTASSDTNRSSASQTLLNHLQGAIQSVSLLAHGPSIRVRIEIKPGTLTHYDLDLDQAAKFLQANTNVTNGTKELNNLKVFSGIAEIGTRIYQDEEEEKITAEKVVAIKLTKRPSAKVIEATRLSTIIKTCYRATAADPKGESALYQFISFKKANKYIGKEFFFLPGCGYWKLERKDLKPEWEDLPLAKIFKEDNAAKLALNNFQEYLSTGPIWLEKTLRNTSKLRDIPNISEISVHAANNGWFYLDPKYGIGKSAISMAQLRKQYRGQRREYFKQGNTWMKIPDFVTEHDWDIDEEGKYLKVDALGLLRLKASVGDFDKFVGSKTTLNKIRNQVDYSHSAKPPSLKNTNLNLRPYQTEGLHWMWWLYTNNLHGLLADEMGLGKTHQAMAILSAIQATQKNKESKNKFLVVCPTSVLEHWRDKIKEFAPSLSPAIFHGTKRSTQLDHFIDRGSVLITSYGVLLRDSKKLASIDWSVVILDEAHYVKNNSTATYKSACKLPARMRICLTGTPMENHLGELKNLFDFLVPGYLGSDKYFRKNFIRPIEQDEDIEKELTLQKLLYPFKLRRIKKKVLSDLPQKIEDIRRCSLSEEQVKLYRDVINEQGRNLLNQLSDEQSQVSYLHVFATLQMLKQICDHPALLIKGSNYKNHHSGKFELLKELIDEALESDNKIVIFSQYVEMIKIIGTYLSEQSIKHVIMTGQTRNRGQVIESFQKDESIKIFVGSLLAGGIGIDLTSASVVIHYDRWWNASKENQATDRVHRIGQKNFVQVIKMITRGTLEEKIDKIISSKQSVFNKFLEKDEEIFKSLSRQDLIELLSQ
ncbi:MAG: DEAD/DEAH box helicase [Bdellovibrionota bacterium]